ncbi:ABC transporter ATP-binding protein [Candidatus Peregrinibacteria bacterium]|jgi:ATP-binding cassette, subfamily B, bacterial|nr:ABC transporter ATP-binding protein [Candidatus Peregrinibacteria bacterium]MBT4632001.1 ABC transporter ATP-binding protein [Candidatus Peregrinibacteria bacterium]MBT5516947.1 ABC transporter ATP-binding protein [Candidatus Peregrinibacteria bacterium]MBT5823796.1 ABC transporter ATP-binding protein [Candidatus Peregrinibacteria bacterium]
MRKTTKQTLNFYKKYLKQYKWLTLLTFGGVGIGVMANYLSPIFYREFVDAMVASAEKQELFKIVGFILMAYLINTLGWRIGTYGMIKLQPIIMAEMSQECFKKIHSHSYRFFSNEFVGSLVKRVNRTPRSFEKFMDVLTFELFTAALRVTIATVVLFVIHPILGSAILVWSMIFLVLHYYISRYKLEKYDLKETAAETKVTAELADSLTNNINIKLFASEVSEKKRFDKTTISWRDLTYASWLFSHYIETIQSALMIALNILILVTTVHLWSNGLITVGTFVLIQVYMMDVFTHIWHTGRHLQDMHRALADAEEMTIILNQEIEVLDAPNASELKLSRGDVEFKKVEFAYDKSNGILKKLSFKVKPGEKIALIGPSGGGKTTITKLLFRFFDIQEGKIFIDGQDISQLKQESLRSQIALVPQDPILFHRSLEENISYGRIDASKKEIIAASKMANCDQFIAKLPNGYATKVGERGIKLSGGERQRIAIARAILSNTKILILDEATSNLDVHSEKLIQDALQNLMKNKTTFVIAHRLSTIVQMDRILVLDKGKIIEQGSHAVLLNKPDSLYKSLWSSQMEGYLT